MANPSIWDLLVDIENGIPESLGQKTSAQSMPVVIASDQSPIPISGTVTTTGGATAANQVLEIAALNSIDAGIPAALGQNTMANSMPVAIASDQSTLPVSAASLPLPSGAATAANQATEIASLASIDAGIPAALGQTTMAASMPVAIASNQSAVPISAASLPLPTGAATETTLAAINTKLVTEALNFGVATSGLRTASIIGNASAVADFAGGSVSAQTLAVVQRMGSTPTRTDVSTSTTSATLLAANANRLSATIFNDSTGVLLVKYGTTAASATDFTTKIPPGQQGFITKGEYNGQVVGILDTGTGTARMTQVTA